MLFWFLAAFCGSGTAFAQDLWAHQASEHFTLYGPPGISKELLQGLEVARDFFLENPEFASGVTADPIRVLVFRTEAAYAPYRVGAHESAYYRSIHGRDYLVAKDTLNLPRVLRHEYAHCVFAHSGLHLPPALEEGLAELYSTINARGSSFLYGADLADRLDALRVERYDIASLLGDRAEGLNGDPRQIARLYAEAWLLCHMFVLCPRYRTRWECVISASRTGAMRPQGLDHVCNLDPDVLAFDLQEYLANHSAGTTPRRRPFQVHAALADDLIDANISPGLNAALAELVRTTNPESERIEARLRKQVDVPIAEEAIGYLALRKGDRATATEYLTAAALGGVDNDETLALVVNLQRHEPRVLNKLVPALQRAVDLHPSNQAGVRLLGLVAAKTGHYTLAIAMLSRLLAQETDPANRSAVQAALEYSYVESEKSGGESSGCGSRR